jgi:hypothetical protein
MNDEYTIPPINTLPMVYRMPPNMSNSISIMKKRYQMMGYSNEPLEMNYKISVIE